MNNHANYGWKITWVNHEIFDGEEVGTIGPSPGTVMEWTGEWVVVCDKCGLIDKSDNPTTAEARAARHKEMPHR